MKRILLFTITCALHTVHAQGQDLRPSNEDNNVKFQKNTFIPGGNSFSSNSVTNAALVSTSDGTTAVINLGVVRKSSRNSNTISGNIELSGPVSKGGVTRPVNLDGLSSDGKVTVGLQFKSWKNDATASEMTKAFGTYNQRHNTNFTAFMDLPSEAAKRELLDIISLGTPWFLGATGSINKQDFEYATDATLSTVEEEQKYAMSGSLYLGLFLGRSLNTLVRFSASYQKGYKGNSTNEYLVPFNGGSSFLKRQLAVGKPTETSGMLYRAEMICRIKEIAGINPSITYRSSSSDVVIDFPIYFVENQREGKPVGLNGGIYVNYVTSLDSPFTVGVFIGANLSELLTINR
jgi:hypothetical protein